MKRILLLLLLIVLNYSIKAQINVNGNIYIGGNDDSIFIAKNTSVGFDTLYIGRSGMSIIQSPYLKCDAGAALYARGGINVYTVIPEKIQMDTASSINLLNVTGNNKTFEINVDPNVNFIQNLNFIDVLDNVSNVYLASNESEIRVLKNFNFSDKWAQTVTLQPRTGVLDLFVGGNMTGNISANNLSYIVTTNQNTTLSRPVVDTTKFWVGSGINRDSFFSPIKIVPTIGTSNRVKVASLYNASKHQPFLEGGGEREEYVNNLWYIDAPGINIATVGIEHNPNLEIPEIKSNDLHYYYPNDTATIIRYVGITPNIVGGDTSFSKWETMKWADTRNNTTIANITNNPNLMIVQDPIHQYMERKNINNFSRYPYFAKVRYADDKAPLKGAVDKGATVESGHLTVPDYINFMASISGPSQITLTFTVKNEYRILGYEIYRNDINDPTFDPNGGGSSLILAGTIDAVAKTNFDTGRYELTYKFVDSGISSVNNTSSFYYQLRPIGGTGRGIRSSDIKEAGYATTKKLTILGNPVSKVQSMIRYRFVSADIQYASLRVVLVNSAGSIVGVNNDIKPEQTKFYEDNTHFPTRDLAGGVYLLIAQATRDDGKVELFTTRIIVE